MITDGSGKKTHFYTNMHKWHKMIEVKKGPFYNREPVFFYPEQWTPYSCHIEKEELPNGNQLHYKYVKIFKDKYFPSFFRVASITALNQKGEILGWLKFDYPENKKKSPTAILISGSDSRSASCGINHQITSYSVVTDNGFYYLGNCSSPQHPYNTYYYDNLCRLNHSTRPDGRVFSTTYTAEGKVYQQIAPVGANGEPLPIATFSYYPLKTHLRDGEGNLTIFTYNSDSRMTQIERFQKNDLLFNTESYQWSGKGELISKSLSDHLNQVLLKTEYVYDERGNVLEEHLLGNLTGNGQQERYTIYRTYSSDGFNLKLSETDGSGKSTRYYYKPQTNLLIAEFVYDNNKICKRTFHDYDESAICIKTIQDDGTSENPFDLQHVSFQKITEVVPKKSLPCYGLPESILEKTIDESGQEF